MLRQERVHGALLLVEPYAGRQWDVYCGSMPAARMTSPQRLISVWM